MTQQTTSMPKKTRLLKSRRTSNGADKNPNKKPSAKKRKTAALLAATASAAATTAATIARQQPREQPLEELLSLLDEQVARHKDAELAARHKEHLARQQFNEWYRRWRVGCAVHFDIVNVNQQHSCYLEGCTSENFERFPEPYEDWFDVPHAIYMQCRDETRRRAFVDANGLSCYQVFMRRVPETIFYACKRSGRHHRCRPTTHQCPFVCRPNHRQMDEADVYVCLQSGVECSQEFAPQEWHGDRDKMLIRDQQRATDRALRLNDKRLQRMAAEAAGERVDDPRVNERGDEMMIDDNFVVLPVAKRRKLTPTEMMTTVTTDRITNEPVPWSEDAPDLFFGRDVDTHHMRSFSPDELSPHWLHANTHLPPEHIQQLPVDDYWCVQLFRDEDGKPLECIREFIERHEQQQSLLLATRTTMTTTMTTKAPWVSAAVEMATDDFARQEVARFLTAEIWHSPLRKKTIGEHVETVVPLIFKRMIRGGGNNRSSGGSSRVQQFIDSRLKPRHILQEAEWTGRHAVAIALASGRLTTHQCWNDIMGTSNSSKYPHHRVSNAYLITTLLECGIEQYLYHRFAIDFLRETGGIELAMQLDEIYKHWVATQIPASSNLFEPLAV